MRTSLALACALLLPASARADTQLYSHLADFSVQTVDLAPADGVDPYWQALRGRTEVTARTWFSGGSAASSSTGSGDALVNVTAQQGRLYATSTTYGTPLVDPAGRHTYSMGEYGHTLQTGQGINLSSHSTIELTLGANTMILLTGEYFNGAQISADSLDYRASGWASAQFTEPFRGESRWSVSDENGLKTFTLGYVNNSDAAIELTLTLDSGISLANRGSVAGAISAVPEPSGYLMFAGGIALLGAFARRRGASRAASSPSA